MSMPKAFQVGLSLWIAFSSYSAMCETKPAKVMLANASLHKDRGVALGIAAGNFGGLSLFYDNRNASNGGPKGTYQASISFADGVRDFLVAGDYLTYFKGPNHSLGDVRFYYGLGGFFGSFRSAFWPQSSILTQGDSITGARITIGLQFVFLETPLQLFAEVGPALMMIPSTFAFWGGQVGLRIFIGSSD